MAQLWCKAAAGDCVVPRCLNIAHGTLIVYFHDSVEEFLICTVLSTGHKQLELIKMVVDIVYLGLTAMIRERIHLAGLLSPRELIKLLQR